MDRSKIFLVFFMIQFLTVLAFCLNKMINVFLQSITGATLIKVDLPEKFILKFIDFITNCIGKKKKA